jgi:hypothetical protein
MPAFEPSFLPPHEVRGRFDRAVAYWNAGRFWHAHEDWEDLWNEAEGAHRLWLQGLIQYAAAFVHFARGFHASGFARLVAQATEKVAGYAGETHHLDWPRLVRDLVPWIAHARAVAAGADLRAGAPGDPPRLFHEPGYEPAPFPLEPEDDPEGD